MADNLLFILPAGLEESLWALSPLSKYLENWVAGKRREYPQHIDVVCPEWQIHQVVRSLWPELGLRDVLCNIVRNRADMVMDFDVRRAYKLSEGQQKHIGEAFGLMIGTLPTLLLPPVAQAMVPEKSGTVLVVGRNWADESRDEDWPELNKFIGILNSEGVDAEILPSSYSWPNLVRKISQSACVVGVEGTPTLLGAVFNKFVLEFSPEDWHHRNWKAKWECNKYNMIRCNLKELNADYVWETLYQQVKSFRKGVEDGISATVRTTAGSTA